MWKLSLHYRSRSIILQINIHVYCPAIFSPSWLIFLQHAQLNHFNHISLIILSYSLHSVLLYDFLSGDRRVWRDDSWWFIAVRPFCWRDTSSLSQSLLTGINIFYLFLILPSFPFHPLEFRILALYDMYYKTNYRFDLSFL